MERKTKLNLGDVCGVRLQNSIDDPRMFRVVIEVRAPRDRLKTRSYVAIEDYFADGIVDHWANAEHSETWKRARIVYRTKRGKAKND